MMSRVNSLFFLWVLSAAFTTAPVRSVEHGEALIEWLHSSNDGFFHSMLDFRENEPHDASPMGLLANGDIKQGEVLIKVPGDFVIIGGAKENVIPKVGNRIERYLDDEVFQGTITLLNNDGTYDIEYEDEDTEEDVPSNGFRLNKLNYCNTVNSLLEEMKLGESSRYAPFVNYLRGLPATELPMTWSKAGRSLLLEIVGYSEGTLPPYSMKTEMEECNEASGSLNELAHRMVLRRAWNDSLIPFFDMLGHRNGHWVNAEIIDPVREGESVEIRASRDIQAGETIFTSYNLCTHCTDRAASAYGTPEILRDYGFVEQYPQRWYFEEEEIAFDIDGDSSAGFKLKKISEKHRSTKSGFRFLQEQLQRLQDLEKLEFITSPDPAIPKHEFETIVRYHKALSVAMTHAMEAMDKMNESRKAKGKKGWSINSEGCLDDVNGTCFVFDRYDPLKEEVEEWRESRPTVSED
jgi:hypothetical protein